MADNVQDTQGGAAGDGAPQGTTTTNTDTRQPGNGAQGQRSQQPVGGIDTQALKKRLERARRSGEGGATTALLQRLGVKSIEELEAKVKGERSNGGKPKGEPKQTQRTGGSDKSDRERRHLEAERDRQFKRFQRESELRKALEQEIATLRAEQRLREAAVRAGIVRTDHALLELRRHAEGLKPEERTAFDEVAFMTKLAEREPWLRNTTTEPATTGNAGAGAPPAPKPGNGAGAKPFDAMTADPKDFMTKLRGLRLPAAGAGR